MFFFKHTGSPLIIEYSKNDSETLKTLYLQFFFFIYTFYPYKNKKTIITLHLYFYDYNNINRLTCNIFSVYF